MQTMRILKKALIFQGLFLCPLLWAQALIIKKPARGEALENPQTVEIEVVGATPTRLSLFLNGKRIKARRKPPYTFSINWNTSLANELRAVAQFADADPIEVSRSFEQIKVDVAQSVDVFHCFPMLDKPASRDQVRLQSRQRTITPTAFEPAERYRMDLVIALDVSGSMALDIPDLEPGLRMLSQHARQSGWRIRLLAFDDAPRLLAAESWPDQLKDLAAGKGQSVVYDSLAVSTRLFDRGPRRMILLISDGADSGGEHSAETAGIYLRNAGAVLVWLNPTGYQNRELLNLAIQSGGALLRGEADGAWSTLFKRLESQYYLEAPEASYPIKLTIPGSKPWYPRWE